MLGVVVYTFVIRFERHCARGHKKILDGGRHGMSFRVSELQVKGPGLEP